VLVLLRDIIRHGLSVQELKDNVKAVQTTSNRLVIPKPVTKKKPKENKTKTTQTTLAPDSTAPVKLAA
jgi:hypothetical protein